MPDGAPDQDLVPEPPHEVEEGVPTTGGSQRGPHQPVGGGVGQGEIEFDCES